MIAPLVTVGSPVPVLIALGANIGDPPDQLRTAIARLSQAITISAISNVFVTEPVGRVPDQPDFFNLVLCGTSEWTVYALLALGQQIESQMGRDRGVADGPRPIDVDLLAFGELALRSDRLSLPHPRLHERVFVLAPLAEIEPGWKHPITRRTPAEMLGLLGEPTRIARWGPLGEDEAHDWPTATGCGPRP